MRIAATLLLLSTVISLAGIPADAQIYQRGTTFGGAAGGGAFGGGSAFGNGSVQMYNPAFAPRLYGGGYPYAGGYPYGGGYAPIYTPTVVPGYSNFFKFGPVGINYWRSNSGYYYPWSGGGSLGVPQQIYYINQGQTQAQNPPVYSMLTDMRQYLDESRKAGRLTDGDYQHLFRRVQDIQGKYDHLMAMNGALDPTDEDQIRRDAGLLGSEISQRIKPLAPGSSAGPSSGTRNVQPSKSGWVEENK